MNENTNTDWLDELCSEPASLSKREKIKAWLIDFRNDILTSPEKMIATTLMFTLALLSLFGALLTGFFSSGAGALNLGSCDDADRHVIVPGDTLSSIATALGADVETLATWNDIDDPDIILVGDTLCRVPPDRRHEVLAGVVTDTQAATHCVGGATQGALALEEVIITKTGYPSLGIYNCRTSRGGSTTSTHGEGRAVDIATNTCTDGGRFLAREVARWPGVQRVVYCDIEWTAYLDQTIDDGWRQASATLASWHGYVADGSPALGPAHLHIELTREAAAYLTIEDYTNAYSESLPTPVESVPAPVEPAVAQGALQLCSDDTEVLRETLANSLGVEVTCPGNSVDIAWDTIIESNSAMSTPADFTL